MTGAAVPAASIALSSTLIEVAGALALVSLVPVVWAIVDLVRRPAWQFSTGRKVLWALTLGFGWVLLWPMALVMALLYLTVLRRRFPPAAGVPPWQAHPWQGPAGRPGAGPPRQGPPGWQGPPPQRQPAVPPTPPPPPPPSSPPAGWYPDPAGGSGQRWWDGVGWTAHVR